MANRFYILTARGEGKEGTVYGTTEERYPEKIFADALAQWMNKAKTKKEPAVMLFHHERNLF